jgi:peptidylprolyl isomerase
MHSTALGVGAALVIFLVGCNGKTATTDKPTSTGPTATGEAPKASQTGSLDKLVTKDKVVGKGPAAAEGDTVFVLYKGTLKNGTVFDSTEKRDNEPFSFQLGPNAGVIPGWNQGIPGMKVGGERTLEIPYKLAYGEEDKGEIPAKSDLYFDVKLIGLIKKGDEMVVDKKDVKVGTGRAVKKGDKIEVKYSGKLINGKQFDAGTFSFTVGANPKEVIPGFDVGVLGMQKGGVRKLTIPPDAGYGPGGNPPAIPGNSILDFEIELLGFK